MSIDFAVKVNGIHEPDGDECAWVLATNETSVLIVHKDKTIHWHPLEDCTFAMAKVPGPPKVPKQAAIIEVPNRVQRRALERNGG